MPGGSVTGPSVGTVTPARSSGAGGGSFVYTFTDTNGWQDLRETYSDIDLFVAPEFLRQGSALQDIRAPTRVVVGTLGEHPQR